MDARHHQETPDTRSLWVQFVTVSAMKVPTADRRLALSTNPDSIQTEAISNPIALELDQVFAIVYYTLGVW